MKQIKLSETTKEKLRYANLGKQHTEATKEKCRISSTGRKHTEEAKTKMSKIKKERDAQRRLNASCIV